MGPRPSHRGAAATTGGRLPVQAPEAAPRPVAPVGALSPRRSPVIPTAMLPADMRRDLSAIVQQLRNVPRTLIGDPAEVVHFLGRTARALERVRDRPIALPTLPPATTRTSAPTPAPPSPPRALSALERAEAVFRSADAAPDPTTGETAGPLSPPAPPSIISRPSALPRPRIVHDRKGRGVRVEVRRAREAGQMEMPV